MAELEAAAKSGKSDQFSAKSALHRKRKKSLARGLFFLIKVPTGQINAHGALGRRSGAPPRGSGRDLGEKSTGSCRTDSYSIPTATETSTRGDAQRSEAFLLATASARPCRTQNRTADQYHRTLACSRAVHACYIATRCSIACASNSRFSNRASVR